MLLPKGLCTRFSVTPIPFSTAMVAFRRDFVGYGESSQEACTVRILLPGMVIVDYGTIAFRGGCCFSASSLLGRGVYGGFGSEGLCYGLASIQPHLPTPSKWRHAYHHPLTVAANGVFSKWLLRAQVFCVHYDLARVQQKVKDLQHTIKVWMCHFSSLWGFL